MQPPRVDDQGRLLCAGHTKAGKPCRSPAITGGSVCRMHGGSAPQVKEAAERVRLEHLVGPALMVMRDLLLGADAPPNVKARVAEAVLDRTGHARRVEVAHLTEDVLDAEIARLEAELAQHDGSA